MRKQYTANRRHRLSLQKNERDQFKRCGGLFFNTFGFAITIIITGLLLIIPPLTTFFEFETLTISQLFTCIGIGFTSVIWYELVKIKTRIKNNADRQGSS